MRAITSLASLAAILLATGCSDEELSPVQQSGSSGTSTGGAGSGGSGDGTLIATESGPVQGSIVGQSRAFLGIPFAAPPLGDLRWKPPQPHESWTDPRDATKRGPACAQLGTLSPTFDKKSSEDCLTLNVWAPAKPSATPAPVMFWVHGGSFVIGSGGELAYDGQRLAEATGAIVVTINYRLGPLGFLAHPDLAAEDPGHPASGMYGFEDQRAALAWTRDNIAAFGGDPASVTLFGESAGGMSTCMHLVSPPSEGLFARAIIESGACTLPALVKPRAAAEAQGQANAQALGCTGPDPITCMRGKTAEEVLMAIPSSAIDVTNPNGWTPTVDGIDLPDTPAALMASGAIADVPVVLGTNADEGTLFFAFGDVVTDEASYKALIEKIAPGKGDAIVAHYPSARFGSPEAAAAAAFSDAAFACPARTTARALVKAGNPTWLYRFTYAPPGALLPDLGSFHSSELPYVFANPMQLLPKAPTETEAPLVATIQGYWGRMSAKGDPNGEGTLAWPGYAAAEENVVLDMEVAKQTDLEKVDCDFWDAL